ncbi:helix-turn-helix transcriptional regulator [Streptomyces camelliae]|uniref:LuxR C-terminal-related transcriptional regulator n=1 Tax=Streptomyces camelliae TaxID=3004093 RepID=A0ABY7NTL5_9ACTN|nr:LuxR family transcriptional regulator [Streptomyces sp. HUAS 2-6]WBO61507.1 LuxR C-terminal-related transcriptional regulator [Streptomyces sp. HUAS 2-6]
MVLGVLGLEPVVETVYAALLRHPRSNLSDLQAVTGLTEQEVRAALDELADRAFVRPSRDIPGGLRVVSPQVALDLMVRRQEADLARRAQELAASKAAAAEAVAAFGALAPNTPVNGAERLVGMDAIEGKLEFLAKELQRECLSVMPGGAQSQASLDASRPLDADALGRGIAILTLYQESVRNDQATHDYAHWLTKNGGEVRTAPLLPPRMLIFDRETAIVPIDPADTRAGALCTREPGIVASLVAVYEQAWATAVPLGAATTRDTGTGLTPAERELLTLLARGMTDEAAAKRLGIGLRTVRRQMATLMERLGASSRFEAGLKAAQRGWL